ncbi:putative Hydantoin utilization protein A [Glarea lozoyensis 74030]|uniref:Putative Hydantoin utilization protein A n=1 Tax=Glarea lozoyensis (strain ATCC 74030 / MF5533) TaxID=1104152 RepID=H0ESP4_GLAL7|nr:putative Hydantoin utilization protein A [Glarea lozoyensis 74030]
MFNSSQIDPKEVASVTIGTTHFINAVVEQDEARLAKVAVVRLCGPFSRGVPPCVDWPKKLRELLCAYFCFVDGGLEVDGSLISEINEEQIRKEAEVIKEKGIRSVVVNGVFSPVDVLYQQEEKAAAIIKQVIPEADVVVSKDVANLGFLERENAAILNASILPFARKTIDSFQSAISRLSLQCPVFITQNDGTILLASAASKLPIRTFSSGPTNSMRGAAFLTQNEIKEAMMVVDIGGTTTDVGLLLANGFPRQAAAFSEVSGVRTNFSYPDVRSIGLGGGSIVRPRADGSLTIGPDSVGYQLPEKAVVFGGQVHTATDYTVLGNEKLEIGDRSLVVKAGLEKNFSGFQAVVKKMLERAIDTMKTSADDIPVLLVGGGAVIAPNELTGASKVVKPEFSGVANAIGAATARVSGVVDTVESTESKSASHVMEEVSKRAIKKAVDNGAKADTVQVVEMDHLPLQYIANKSRFIIKAVGDFDFSRNVRDQSTIPPSSEAAIDDMEEYQKKSSESKQNNISNDESSNLPDFDIQTYKPKFEGREWIISDTDLQWITIGCYILGTGGGGSPYQYMLRLRELMRKGSVVRVISPDDLKDEDLVACGGGKGSPTVGSEKLAGDEMMEAQTELYKYMGVKPDAVIALEIGGGNGLQGRAVALSRSLNSIDTVAESIINEVGGEESAKVLWKGKITGVERTLRMGHVYGEVIIENVDMTGTGDPGDIATGKKLKIPFKNENILTIEVSEDGHEEVSNHSSAPSSKSNYVQIIASVPDLICVIDAQNGEAIGTPEYRYGLLVIVLGITASEKWTSTARGLEIGGPKGFGMDDVVYKPIGVFKKPISVIDEYAPK